MIELRWLEKRIGPRDEYEIVKVLQYRVGVYISDNMGSVAHWSDWMDVPTVREYAG